MTEDRALWVPCRDCGAPPRRECAGSPGPGQSHRSRIEAAKHWKTLGDFLSPRTAPTNRGEAK